MYSGQYTNKSDMNYSKKKKKAHSLSTEKPSQIEKRKISGTKRDRYFKGEILSGKESNILAES